MPAQVQRGRWGSLPGQGHGRTLLLGNRFVVCGGESVENERTARQQRRAPRGSKVLRYFIS